jgi:phage repressor protein C with HTH and peptisase S24 domain
MVLDSLPYTADSCLASDMPEEWGLPDSIRWLRKARKWSQRDLAEQSGLGLRTVIRLEGVGDANYERASIQALASAFGLDEVALLQFQPPTVRRQANEQALQQIAEAEREDVDTYAGYKRDNLPVVVEGEASPQGNLFWNVQEGKPLIEADEWMSRPGDVTDPRAYGVRVRGDSMVPAFYPGMRLIVSPNRRVKSGDRVYVELHTGERLIKVARKERAGWILESLNPAYPPRFIQDDEVGTMHKVVYAREL